MSELQDAKQQSREEEDLRNLLNVQDTIDDALHEIDEVVNTTENDLFYVSAHQINGRYSKLLDELMESHLPNSSNGKNYNSIGKDERQSTGLFENIGKDEGLQLCSEPPENSNHLVLSAKQADIETVISTKSSTSEEIKVCSENQRYFCNVGGFPLQNKKSDTGLKRPIVSPPKEERKTNGETIRNICKKLKADSPNEFFNIHTILQKRPTNMSRKPTSTNFRGPIGVSIESIAVILLDTKKPATCYRYPVRKPEYGFPRMSAGNLKRASQKISVTVCSMREYRKVIAYPYGDDYIELTDTFLAQELEEEYKNIVRSDCSNTVDEAHNFLNSPNRTIKLIESSSASSVEDFFDAKINKINLNNVKSEENSENKQRFGSFKENPWNNINHPLCVQTEQENRISRLFSDIVPLPIQIDVEMLNIGKNTNYDEEHLTQSHSNKNNSDNQDDPLLDPSDPTELSSECISCELSLYSPIKLTPISPVYRNATLETDLKSDLRFSPIHRKDQNNMSDILETDDAEGKNSMSICNAKTFNKANRAGLVALPIETEFKKKIEISACEINIEETNALDIDQNFYFGSDSIGNNSKQISEVDDNPLSDSNTFDTCSISTITANNGFDSDSGSITTDSSKTTRPVYENFALVPTELSTNSEGRDMNSSFTIQKVFDFNDTVNFIGTENAFCNQNVDDDAVVSFKSFEFAAATIKNTENRSSANQDEDVEVASDISITSRKDAFEFKNQNTAKLIGSKDGDTVVLSDSDNENKSCRTESAEEYKQSKVTINVTSSDDDLSPDFIPFKKYKIGSEYNQDEDVISISGSSSQTDNEYFEAENALAQQMYDTNEESIAKCELNHDDMNVSESYKLNSNNATPVETKNSKTTNAATFKLSDAENVIDLIDSSLDSVISINSDDALASSPEESITKPFSEGQDKCTNTSSAVSNASNRNTVPLITHGINFKNYKESISDKNQSINFNGNIENEFLSHTKGKNFLYENKMTEQNQSSAAVSTISTTTSYLDSRSSDCGDITFFNSNNNTEQACEDVQKDESNSIFSDDVRVSDNAKELCNTEDLHMNENSLSQPVSEDSNINNRAKNVAVPEAEGSISSTSCTVECKEVDNVCTIQTNSPKDETSVDTLVNVDALFCIEAATNDKSAILSDQNIFTSIQAENPSDSSNNQNNTKDVSTSISTETEIGVNPIMNPKCIMEQFKIVDRIMSPHNHVRVGDDTKMGLCNTEDLLMNENSFSRRFLEGCNKIIRVQNVTVPEAEGSIRSTSCTVESKEVSSVCAIYQPDSPKEKTSVDSLVNVDALFCIEAATNDKSAILSDQNIFTSIQAQNPSDSSNNQNNTKDVSTSISTETEIGVNPIMNPKCIMEQFKIVDRIMSPHNHVRVGDDTKMGLCNTEDLLINENSFSRRFLEGCNKIVRVKNVTVPEAEGSITSTSCTVECKEVDSVCAIQTNSPKDETSVGSLVNVDTLVCFEGSSNGKSPFLSDQNIFTSIHAENPSDSSNNQNNTKDVSTYISTETENGVNPIMNPKCIMEQFKIVDRIMSPHNHVRVGDDTKMGLCNTEDLPMNENSFSRRFLEGCNKIIRVQNVTVPEAEGSIRSTSCTVESKEVSSVCAIYQPDSPKDETSMGSLVNVDTLVSFEGSSNGKSTVLSDQNIFTSIHAENPSNSLDNQNNTIGVSTFVQNTETENSENPIIKPKFILEQFEKVDDLTPSVNQHFSNENISNISSYSSSAVSNVKIFQNSDIKHQNNISPECLLTHNNSSTPPLVSEQIENTMHDTTNLLELPYIHSEIGMRCNLSNYTSHTVPDLDLNNSSQTYVPTININSDFVHKCDNTVDVNRNCTVTSSECLITEVCQDNDVCNTPNEFEIFNCDKEKEGQINLKTSELTVQINCGLETASNTPSSLNTCSTTTPSQAVLKTDTEAHDNSSKLNVAASSIHTVHANKIITGVKRPLASTSSDKTNKRCKPSSTNITHQAQPSTSKTTPVANDTIDAKEIADNNDPKWKLYNFSEPHDFFLATRNQWCAPMPNPHADLTRRHCIKNPTNISHCIIPGDQKILNIECLRVYEEQLHEINTKSANLKHDLDMYGQCWNQRRINQTLNQLRHLDNMHDVLREAWDDAYHFYVYSKTSESDQGAWCMSKFNQNEIARSLEMIRAYDMYYGHTD